MFFSASKPQRVVVFSALAIIVSMAVDADTAAQVDSQYKIGIVNIKDVFDQFDKQKEKYAELQRKMAELQKPIDELSAQIERDRQRYEAERDQMTEEQRRTMREKIERDLNQYQAKFKENQANLDLAQKHLNEELFAEIRQAIDEIGKQGNYHLILEVGAPQGGRVLYYSSTLNITPRVIEYLNSQS